MTPASNEVFALAPRARRAALGTLLVAAVLVRSMRARVELLIAGLSYAREQALEASQVRAELAPVPARSEDRRTDAARAVRSFESDVYDAIIHAVETRPGVAQGSATLASGGDISEAPAILVADPQESRC